MKIRLKLNWILEVFGVCKEQRGFLNMHLHDEADIGGEGLDSVEASDERDGEEALRIHFSPQEEVSLQVVVAEVVLTGERKHSPP